MSKANHASRSATLALLIAVGVLALGCGARIGSKPEVTIIPYEAQQRAVLTKKQDVKRTVCVEPPPMTARNVTLKVEGKVKAKEYAEVAAEVARSTSHEQLYQLDQLNLLLQYALYRLCELGMNGGVTPAEAFAQYTRIVDQIVALTAANADAIKEKAVLDAVLKERDRQLEEQREQIDEQKAKIATMEAELRAGKDAQEAASTKLTQLAGLRQAEVGTRDEVIAQLQQKMKEWENQNKALSEALAGVKIETDNLQKGVTEAKAALSQ